MRIQTVINHLSPRKALGLLAFFSASMLGAAFVAQYGFDLHPCHLCLLQRYPYAAVILIGAGGCLVKSTLWQRRLIWLAALLFLSDAGIAFYHAGVEAGVFPGPDGCSNSSTGGETLEELRRQIMNAPLVTCDQAMTHIWGLSLAAWNGVAAIAAFVATVYFLRRKK